MELFKTNNIHIVRAFHDHFVRCVVG